MGKKSKKQQSFAKPKAKVDPSAEPDDANVSISGGGSTKRLRCKSCVCNLKDLAKAHLCPGCEQIFCWRCERKFFKECPNGTGCVGQARRCVFCYNGSGMDLFIKVHEKKNEVAVPPEMRVLLLEKYIADGRVNIGAELIPFQKCGVKECGIHECRRCLLDPADTALFHCAVCQRIRCYDCKTVELNADPPSRDVMTVYAASAAGVAVTPSQMDAAVDSMRRDTPNKWAACGECNASFCYGCLDDESARALLTSMATNAQAFGVAAMSSLVTQVPGRVKGSNQFRCSTCYWTSKPCTNPSCPNEVGVPTKRCGGCHLDRYCSVECQKAAYPDHVGRCDRIREKRAAAGKTG